MDILGVRVDNLDREEIFKKISVFMDGNEFRQIATINPEIILKAQEYDGYKNILNDCYLNVADGFGITCAFWRFKKKLKYRIAGIDLMWEILEIADKNNQKVFLAANGKGLSSWEETRDAILNKYPNLKINGLNMDYKNPDYLLPITNYQVIFCNFGAPYQEKFLNSLKNDILGLAVGVGGSFDYITGKIRRAPLFMRKIGMEWLFRLWQQPKRIKRIWNAVVKFTFKIIIN